MFRMTICGMELAADFTAPALLALLSLNMPQRAFLQMCVACLLHESAHLLMMRLLGERPVQLRLSAAGMRLALERDALCPLPVLAAILLAGACANAAAALCFFAAGDSDSAGTNLSLALFNLLPYRSTDGGTLLYTLLEQRYLTRHPARLRHCMRLLCAVTSLLLGGTLFALRSTNLSLWSMLLFMTAAEWLEI